MDNQTQNSVSQHVASQENRTQKDGPRSIQLTKLDSDGAQNHTLQDDAGLKTIETPKKAGESATRPVSKNVLPTKFVKNRSKERLQAAR